LELRGERGEGWEREQDGEMNQTMYAHVNKLKKKKEILEVSIYLSIYLRNNWYNLFSSTEV
jgi:hypothetical protein